LKFSSKAHLKREKAPGRAAAGRWAFLWKEVRRFAAGVANQNPLAGARLRRLRFLLWAVFLFFTAMRAFTENVP